MFDSCVLALERQSSLKSVIIMPHIPRYDPRHIDPLGLKPVLSQIFNNSLAEFWISSPLRHKIHLGAHNIDCTGAVQAARYRHTKTGRFDGIHLFGSSGSKAYTNSVVNIVRSAPLLNKAQVQTTSFLTSMIPGNF